MDIMEMMDITASIPDLIPVTGRYTPASIEPSTSINRPMGPQEFHEEQDQIGTSRGPERVFISARNRPCTNDRKTRVGMQGHPVKQGRAKT
jgi:hypothetical protein